MPFGPLRLLQSAHEVTKLRIYFAISVTDMGVMLVPGNDQAAPDPGLVSDSDTNVEGLPQYYMY